MGKYRVGKTLRAFTFLMVVTFFALNTSVSAQETAVLSIEKELGFTIYPSIAQIHGEPGDTVEGRVVISKLLNEDVPVNIMTSPYYLTSSEGRKYDESYDSTKWVTTEFESIILADTEREVLFTVSIPEDATPGSYFTTLLFQPVLPDDFFELESIHVLPYIGAVLVVQIGTEDKSTLPIDISGFRYKESQVEGEKYFISTITNNDTYYKEVSGKIVVQNIFNQVVDEIDVPDMKLLPSEEVEVSSSVKNYFDSGYYRARLFLFDENDNSSESGTSFVSFKSAMSWVLLVVIVISTTILMVKFPLRKFGKWMNWKE